jgi:hypothetical protein
LVDFARNVNGIGFRKKARSGIVIDWRKLVLLAALSWAAPLAAHEPAAAAGDRARAPAETRCVKSNAHDSVCPRSRRGKGTIGGLSFPPAEYPPAENFLLDTGRRPPKYLP